MANNKQLLSTRHLFWFVILTFFVTWWISAMLSRPFLDSYGDMVENYAWGQTWSWGTFKHPPLIAWVVKIWFTIFPENIATYFMLSYANATVGLLGIIAIAKRSISPSTPKPTVDNISILVLIFASLSLPYSNLAGKFNADTILLSVWPWTTYTFLQAVEASNRKQSLIWSILLGALGALAMLAKYYSGVLLLSIAITTLLYRPYRRWYLSIYPYLSVGVFVCLLTPHLLWEIAMEFPFQNYLSTKIQSGIDWTRIVKFLASGIFYLPLSWILWLTLRIKLKAPAPQVVRQHTLTPLIMLATLPALITIGFHIFKGFHLTTHWAIPIWYVLPILLGINTAPLLATAFNTKKIVLYTSFFGLFIVLLSGIYAIYKGQYGNSRHHLNQQTMTEAVIQRFQSHYPKQQLQWIGGTWPYPAAVAFFAKNHPRGIAGFPNRFPGTVNPHTNWEKQYGAILCVDTNSYAQQNQLNASCRQATQHWLLENSLIAKAEQIDFQVQDWQFNQAIPKSVFVFWISPTTKGQSE